MGTGGSTNGARYSLNNLSIEDLRQAFGNLEDLERSKIQEIMASPGILGEWNNMLKSLGLDTSAGVFPSQWDVAYDKIPKTSMVQLTRQEWIKFGGNPLLFNLLADSEDAEAAINRSNWQYSYAWQLAFAHASKVQAEAKTFFRTLDMHGVLAECLPKDALFLGNANDPLAGLFGLEEEVMDQMIEMACQGVSDHIKRAMKDGRAAKQALETVELSNAGAGKFSGSLKGGDLDDFYAGVTGIVGQPHVNLKEGMRKEHEDMPDSEQAFTTTNYGITTTPKQEHDLVAGYRRAGGDHVKVYGTRRCPTSDGTPQEDFRTIRAIEEYFKLDTVVQVGLTWVEILAIVLYTGPMFILYNGILRGFGCCGAVGLGITFWSKDGRFKQGFESRSVKDRVLEAGHMFASTIHCLASACKKLQRVNSGVQGTWLYRGLGGLGIQEFLDGTGFTEKAFTSTTKSLDVALEYSGASKGVPGTVLAIEMSEVDQGAVLQPFSQYPGEAETLWNACSYMEALKGREEWKLTKWGPVKIVCIKMNACGKAMTVEELEARRKVIVVNMLETLHGDICRDVELATLEERFIETTRGHENDYGVQVKGGMQNCIDLFVEQARKGSDHIVQTYKEKEASWFHQNKQFAQAVVAASTLPELADSWVQCFLEDDERPLYACDTWNFHASSNELRLLRQRELQNARGENDKVQVQRLASELSYMAGYVRSSDKIDELWFEGGETPLLEKCWDGDSLAVRLLLEAGASLEHVNKFGDRPVQHAINQGHVLVLKLLCASSANLEASDGLRTPLLLAIASGWEDSGDMVKLLLEAGSSTDATNEHKRTSLHIAAAKGLVDMAELLLRAKADIEAGESWSRRPLHMASMFGHASIAKVLLDARADIDAKDADGVTAIKEAEACQSSDVVKVLKKVASDAEVQRLWAQQQSPKGQRPSSRASAASRAPPCTNRMPQTEPETDEVILQQLLQLQPQ